MYPCKFSTSKISKYFLVVLVTASHVSSCLYPLRFLCVLKVTPESDFSYASFETNVRLPDYDRIVRGVLEVFRPRKFTMTLFAERTGMEDIKKVWSHSSVSHHFCPYCCCCFCRCCCCCWWSRYAFIVTRHRTHGVVVLFGSSSLASRYSLISPLSF